MRLSALPAPWWPALVLALVLVAGLGVLAARSGDAPVPVLASTAEARPADPLPRDPAGPTRVDLNRASRAELEALPGIGPARAQAIFDARPIVSEADLRARAVLPVSVWESLRDRVILGAPDAAPGGP